MRVTTPKSTSALAPTDPRTDRLYRWMGGVILIVLVLVSFFPAFSAGFVSWDDGNNIVNNPHWRGFDGIHLKWMFTAFHLGHYQPLTWLSFAFDYSLWGMDPQGYHITNVLLHGANAVLFFLLARRLIQIGSGSADPSGRRATTLVAGVAAALWAIHPLRVESVAWVTERRDVLSTLFLLLSALMYVGSVEVGGPGIRSWRRYSVAIVMLALSCLSKAWGMSFFVLLLALDVYPLRRLPTSPLKWLNPAALRVIGQKSLMIVIGLGTAVVAARAQHAGQATKSLAEWPLQNRVVQSIYGLWFYVMKSAAPSDLSPLYQLPDQLNPWEPRYIAAYLFLGAAVLATVVSWRKRPDAPALLVGGAIYVVMLGPVLGILQSGEQMVADRYSYIATMPLALLVSAGGYALVRRSRRAEGASRIGLLASIITGVALISLAALTFAQTAVWHSSLSLWQHAVAAAPCSDSHDYFGDELFRLGRCEDAAEQYSSAIKLAPRDGRAWFCLGNTLRALDRKREAEHAYGEAAKYMLAGYQAYQNLGTLYMEEGRTEDAIHQFELAVKDVEDQTKGLRALSGGPYMTLGMALNEKGKTAEAAAMFRKALSYPDVHAQAQIELAKIGS